MKVDLGGGCWGGGRCLWVSWGGGERVMCGREKGKGGAQRYVALVSVTFLLFL